MELIGKVIFSALLVVFISGMFVSAGGGGSEYVHLKIHLPKIVKKHTHTQTVYKHHYHKKPESSHIKSRVDPKGVRKGKKQAILGDGNQIKWSPKYPSQDLTTLSKGYSGHESAFKKANYYPKVEYGDESQHMSYKIKHVPANYQTQDEPEDEHAGEVNADGYDYAASQIFPTFIKHGPTGTSYQTHEIQFIPASEVKELIPTIPFSALTAAQSKFQPIWTPPETDEMMNREMKLQMRHGNSRQAYKKMIRNALDKQLFDTKYQFQIPS